jgi:hypothetical protein
MNERSFIVKLPLFAAMCDRSVSGERRLPACRSRQLAGYTLWTSMVVRRENQKQHLGKLPRWTGWQPALPGDKS